MAHKEHLNIALVSGSMPPMACGVGDNALAMARTLAERGHHVTIYTDRHADALDEHHLRILPLVSDWSWSGCHALTQALLMDNPDMIILEYPTRGYGRGSGPGLIPTFLKVRRYAGPIVVHLHEYKQAHSLRKWAIWPLLNDADGIIVPSDQEREALLFEHRSLFDRPVVTVPVGPVLPPGELPAATEEQWAAQLKQWEVPADAFPLILSFGFVRKDKGMETLARAIAALGKTSKAHVVHLGPFKPEANVYEELVKSEIGNLIVGDRFHFVGYQPLSVLPATPPRGVIAAFPYTDGISDRRSAAITIGTLGYPILTTTSGHPASDPSWAELATLLPANDVEAWTAALKALATADSWPSGHADEFAARYGWPGLGERIEAVLEEVMQRYHDARDPGHHHAPATAAH